MPYDIIMTGGEHCVVREGTADPLGCHSTHQAAVDQVAAIEASEQRKFNNRVKLLQYAITHPQHKGDYSWELLEVITKAVDPDELDRVYSKFKDTVNMSASELERWADTDCSKEASDSRAPIDRNLRLLRKPKSEWTNNDIEDANRTISFVSRMRGSEQGDPAAEGCPSARDISLRNWAFDTTKATKPTPEPVIAGGFKIADGNKWVAWYSNAYIDKENEIIARKAHEDYIQRVRAGEIPYPELWFMHIKGTRHGVATDLFLIDNFVVAVGVFDDPADNPFVSKMKAWYSEQESVTLSHGYKYDRNEKHDNVYYSIETYEISTLPTGSEANPFTMFTMR